MDEQVLGPVVGDDEPESLVVAEPLHGAGGHRGLLGACVAERERPAVRGRVYPSAAAAQFSGPVAASTVSARAIPAPSASPVKRSTAARSAASALSASIS